MRGRIGAEVESRPEGRVHRITVSNPARLNVLDSGLLCELGNALVAAAEDEEARLVVLLGEGERAWIGGADIGEMSSLDPESARGFITLLHSVCRTIREHPVPVLAGIRGYCLGGGLEIAACCDVRVAETSARFAMPEVRVGIPSVIDAAVLPALIGSGRARDLVMTGRQIDAHTALAWGLVTEVTDAGALAGMLRTMEDHLLAGAPHAMRAQKRLCGEWETLPLETAINRGIEAFSRAYETDEPRRLMTRFLERPRARPRGRA